jgi:hypothetical protein
MKNTYILLIIALITINMACRPKPKVVKPVPVISDIQILNISLSTDQAIALETQTRYTKQSNPASDFAYYNLPVSPEYKSIVIENAVSISIAIMSDGMFNEIKNKASFTNILSQTSFGNTVSSIDLNNFTSPYGLAHKYIYINTKQNKRALIRIDNFIPGVQQNLEATLIMDK